MNEGAGRPGGPLMPAGDEVFLDHVGFFVADLDRAGEQLERLGFQVSQVNVQTNQAPDGTLHPSGTSNRLARLARGYLEVLAATHDTPLGEQLRDALARYAGLHLVALAHDDIPRTRERLVAAGFAMQDVVHLRRHDRTLPGAPEVAWSVLRPQPGVMPEGRIQFAKSHHPDLVWQPDLCIHPNASQALTDLLICVDDPDAVAERFGRYAGRNAVVEPHGRAITLDRGRLLFLDRRQTETLLCHAVPEPPFIAGQAIRSADMAATWGVLAASRVSPLVADDDLILIGPDDGLGAFLLFHAGRVTDPWAALARAG